MDAATRRAMERDTATVRAAAARDEREQRVRELRAELEGLHYLEPEWKRDALRAAIANEYRAMGYSERPVVNGIVLNGAGADFSAGLDPSK